MVVIVPPPPTLNPDSISLFYVLDDLLSRSPILIFYGPSATPTATANNSRIQAHVFSPAGLQSYPRLTISPSSPLYAAVNCLPREEQGDEVCRGLAFSLFKYFAELPPHVKGVWENECGKGARNLKAAPNLFSEAHAAILASRMAKVENVVDVIKDVRQALADQSVSWLDVDVVLPPGAMRPMDPRTRGSAASELDDDQMRSLRYGEYAELVNLFGETAFLPTSRLKRAPSRPTALNRSATFTKKQKENIRREMCELLDTEENYVAKLDHLVHGLAAEFRLKAATKTSMSTSPSEEALATLFPQSLDEILSTNSAFLESLRRIVEDTENDAIHDLESTNDTALFVPSGPNALDPTGSVSLATCLKTWFPGFSESYASYTRSHSQFPQIMKNFTKDINSSFSKRIQETGEQRLMSMLIEPVQRLPRYNLYIDNIIKQLPAKHPAINALLKARDVISEICSQDSTAVSPSRVTGHLHRMIPSWPVSIKPTGRLITAVDAIELSPPYRTDISRPGTVYCTILVFADYLVVLGKLNKSALSARGLLAQIDGQDLPNPDQKVEDLSFRQAFDLHSFDITELDSGRMIQLLPLQTKSSVPRPASRPTSLSSPSQVHVFHLSGMYEGKATRFLEDITKARVEGRYSETERESQKWEVRSAAGNDLNFFVAMSEETFPTPEGRGQPSKVRIRVDPDKFKHSSAAPGVEVYASLSVVNPGLFKLEISGPNEFSSKDHLTSVEFLPVLSKRLSNILQMKHQIKSSSFTKTLLIRNQYILQSLRVITTEMIDASKEKSRPHSPVKLLANIFGGSVRETPVRKQHNATLSLTDIPQLQPNLFRRKSDEISVHSQMSTNTTYAASAMLEKLEEMLSSYLLALQSRKGNIVGKVLRTRAFADELAVNELYNTMLNDPSSHQLAAQVSVDVLFSAFEKFIKIGWQEKMGPIINVSSWHAIEAKLDSQQLGDFEDTFRLKFKDMSPQNQRAFTSIIKLLADLLEGTSNDGDRGILTASFAEVLSPEGNPQHFVSLLDRLVDDIDPLLSQKPYAGHGFNTPSESHHKRSNTVSGMSLNGSLSASSSSLRKRLGLLTRKGSKNQTTNDGEPEGISVWRTLSKSKHGNGNDSQASSLSKASSLHRLSTTDVLNIAGLSPKRPVSRDRPTVLGAFSFENSRPLTTIGEGQAIERPRKKRRSSLSDLMSLQNSASNTPSFLTPKTPSKITSSPNTTDSPRTPSPVKLSFIPQPSTSTIRPSSPNRRENSPVRTLPRAISPPKRSAPISEEVTITSHTTSTTIASPRRRNTGTISSIPTLKSTNTTSSGGLSERPTSGNVRKLPPPPISNEKPTSTIAPLNPAAGKLRMQSPQKIRDRLTLENKGLSNAEAVLQSDISKLSSDLSTLSKVRPDGNGKPAQTPSPESIKSYDGKLHALSQKHSALLTSLRTRINSLEADLLESLSVSEKRARELDSLYRDANAENEALYVRFNEELSGILGAVKSGEGGGEVRRRVKEGEEEGVRLRKENARLRREVVGLRAQLRD